jgi:hypothetical protein
MMEQEKIIEARIKFEEDCDRFTKYVKDVDHQTDLAHKASEEAVRRRIALVDNLERLQNEIGQNERDWIKADDFVKQYLVSRNFVEQVKSLRINFDSAVELPSANSKLPYFMDSKKGGGG